MIKNFNKSNLEGYKYRQSDMNSLSLEELAKLYVYLVFSNDENSVMARECIDCIKNYNFDENHIYYDEAFQEGFKEASELYTDKD